jgi:3-dehydroquinate synthetase
MTSAPSLILRAGLLADLPANLPEATATFLLTDRNVEPLLGDGWEKIPRLVLPPGESSKSWTQLGDILHALDLAGLNRDGLLVAVGGGVVTDLGGLAASLHRRGIPWVAVPTSLVGQVDAAIGGKTAVNLGTGKNTVGTFHQPVRVLVDPKALRTLAPRHFHAGFAEMLKTALIAGDPLWQSVRALQPRAEGDSDREAHEAALSSCVASCLDVKRSLVDRDPFDRGPRRLLNLGHTFGHAFEALALQRSEDELLHGEAVGLGLLCAARLGSILQPRELPERESLEDILRERLASWQLPLTSMESAEDLLCAMRSDKKRLRDTHTVVIPRSVGDITIEEKVPEEPLQQALAAVLSA